MFNNNNNNNVQRDFQQGWFSKEKKKLLPPCWITRCSQLSPAFAIGFSKFSFKRFPSVQNLIFNSANRVAWFSRLGNGGIRFYEGPRKQNLHLPIYPFVKLIFYRTQVDLVRSMCLVSGSVWDNFLKLWCDCDVTVADEDTNSILTDDKVNRKIQGNVAMQVVQYHDR